MIKVYVSYAWNADSELIVDQLEEVFLNEDIVLIRDKSHLKYKDNIRDFMDRLGESNYVIIVISSSYLKSDNCMYELLMIYKNNDFEKRIFPIILKGSGIYNSIDIINHVSYWTDKVDEFEKKLISYLENFNLTLAMRLKYSMR